ncbi:unnamed protein product [Bursaphelenchus xylophilus]|uniref:(pine wood nematode) hypothetical protein n=1 Tax=Bursaphelenchus xylophilus TaxID=6326 RepID=A0A1I7S4H5_BURXY|nr:unnamed protein product [Bursaphelenchus xylophilus]CAG9117101.1 unnamed protein product [Bursaphelenchus xylophilus]
MPEPVCCNSQKCPEPCCQKTVSQQVQHCVCLNGECVKVDCVAVCCKPKSQCGAGCFTAPSQKCCCC